MDPITAIIVYLVAVVVSAAVLYFVVRGAVVSALKYYAVWKAQGGVEADVDALEYARTGVAPTRPTDA